MYIKIEELLTPQSIESTRIEYKSTWDKNIELKTLRTICAFANDLHNIDGGYIILGIEAESGSPELAPPKGIAEEKIEKIIQDIRILSKSRLEPEYYPIVEAVQYQEKWLIVLWIPAGDNRPYKIKDSDGSYYPYIRYGAETIKAEGIHLHQLIEQTARIPYDDRRNLQATLLDISPILVKRFLQQVNSDLLNHLPPLSDENLYHALNLIQRVNGGFVPKNVALLFFSETPHKHFSGAYFEVVQFRDEGDSIEEKFFYAPIPSLVQEVLSYLETLTHISSRKVPNQAEVERTVAFPYAALEETIVNAVYHRSYDNNPEPCKVYLYPDRMEIISYPGPVAAISLEHLQGKLPSSPVPARNRRIGTFLKDLRLAETRGSGIRKIHRTMQANGSPQPIFDFDEGRTYFRVTLPAHPRYVIVHAVRENTYLWTIGEKTKAITNLREVHQNYPESGLIASLLINYLLEFDNSQEAQNVFAKVTQTPHAQELGLVYLEYAKVLIALKQDNEAIALLSQAIPLFQDNPNQQAWSWYEMARLMALRKHPASTIEAAYQQALGLMPAEKTFRDAYEDWKKQQG